MKYKSIKLLSLTLLAGVMVSCASPTVEALGKTVLQGAVTIAKAKVGESYPLTADSSEVTLAIRAAAWDVLTEVEAAARKELEATKAPPAPSAKEAVPLRPKTTASRDPDWQRWLCVTHGKRHRFKVT